MAILRLLVPSSVPSIVGERNQSSSPELKPGEIRLVELRAGDTHASVEICRHIVPFNNKVKYDALSHVVGQPNSSASVNERLGSRLSKLPVSQDLESALRQLRYPDQDRMMWIDALSINQDNVDEKSREIQRMGQIFERAQNVCIWMGSHGDNSELAMNFIDEVADLQAIDFLVRDPNKREAWLAFAGSWDGRGLPDAGAFRKWPLHKKQPYTAATRHCHGRNSPRLHHCLG